MHKSDFLAIKVIVLMLFFIPSHLILSPASEPSAFGTSTESSASGSSKSATSAPNLSDSFHLSVSSSLECEALKLIRTVILSYDAPPYRD